MDSVNETTTLTEINVSEEEVERIRNERLAVTAEHIYDADVQKKLNDLRILSHAKQILAEERAAADFTAPPIYGQAGLKEVIKDIPKYRIDKLMLAGSDTLIVGAHKAGKTTFLLNLIRSLATGEPFLGAYDVTPTEGRILFMNYELPLVLLDEWTEKIGVPEEKLLTLTPSGYSNPLSSSAGREWLTDQMDKNEVEILIVDPFAAATKGLDINEQDNTAVRQWLEQSVSDVRAGAKYVTEAVLTHHSGKDAGKGARGASAFYDWPSSYLELDRKGTQYDSPRYLKANGRDVGLKSTEIVYDEETHKMLLSQGQGLASVRVNMELMVAIVEVVNAEGREMNSKEVENALKAKGIGYRNEEIKPAREEAVNRGLIVGGLGKFRTGVGPLSDPGKANLALG